MIKQLIDNSLIRAITDQDRKMFVLVNESFVSDKA